MVAYLDQTPATLEWVSEITNQMTNSRIVTGTNNQCTYIFALEDDGDLSLVYDGTPISRSLESRGDVRIAIRALGINTVERFDQATGELLPRVPEWLKANNEYVFDLESPGSAFGVTVVGTIDSSDGHHHIRLKNLEGKVFIITLKSFVDRTWVYRKIVLGHKE